MCLNSALLQMKSLPPYNELAISSKANSPLPQRKHDPKEEKENSVAPLLPLSSPSPPPLLPSLLPLSSPSPPPLLPPSPLPPPPLRPFKS
uniref:Uncharacterized protein n=1 Tax=Knipowitschia caucasica TaxID=637954 RepID=A0AAV2JDZ2_KNICA